MRGGDEDEIDEIVVFVLREHFSRSNPIPGYVCYAGVENWLA